MLKKYQQVLSGVFYDQVYPDGSSCDYDNYSSITINQFAVYDVDGDGQEALVTPAPTESTPEPGESYEYQVPDAAAPDMSYGFTLPPTATPSPTPPPLDLSVEED